MSPAGIRKASFAMGCFWGAEAAFGVAKGVLRTKVGYTGGSTANPTYRNLADHTEAVELQYDPGQITYQSLLDIFWQNHEPYVKHKRQYMSAVFYQDQDQKSEAEEMLRRKSARCARTVYTVLLPAQTFYDAENYHQKYALRRHSYLLDSLSLGDRDLVDLPLATRLNGYLNGFGSLQDFEKEADSLGLNPDQIQYLRRAIPNAVTHC